MRVFLLHIILMIAVDCFSQQLQFSVVYQVSFVPKSPADIRDVHPEQFLSTQSLQRRKNQRIEIDLLDFPVATPHINLLKKFNVPILLISKWLNGAAVVLTEKSQYAQLQVFLSILSIKNIGQVPPPGLRLRKKGIKAIPVFEKSVWENEYGAVFFKSIKSTAIFTSIGLSRRGQRIAILDVGFNNMEIMPVFDSLRQTNRWHTREDLVDGNDYLHESNLHGSMVLSVMTANMPL